MTEHKIITLCGSVNYKEEFIRIQKELTLIGNTVFSLDNLECYENIKNDEQKATFKAIHQKKIDMSDKIFVINVNGNIDDVTKSDIEYAKEHKKKIEYLVKPVHYLVGKQILYRHENTVHTVQEVIEFEEDTFGQGDFAVITDDGKYLYECEIDIIA